MEDCGVRLDKLQLGGCWKDTLNSTEANVKKSRKWIVSGPNYNVLNFFIGGSESYGDSVVTSTIWRFWRASLTISSNFEAIESSIQSAPHCEHTDAGTSLTTTTPNPKSTVKVV
jgi:hypothetical protein